jgi:hypothetical protein
METTRRYDVYVVVEEYEVDEEENQIDDSRREVVDWTIYHSTQIDGMAAQNAAATLANTKISKARS